MKLKRGLKLGSADLKWLREAAEAAGWKVEDMAEELRNLDVSPGSRAARYKKLFEEYLREADRLAQKGDTRQAGEKLWGAVTALIKFYAAAKGVPVIHWSRGRLDRFVDNNVEDQLRWRLQQLLDTAGRLHEHFYENNLTPRGFEERYRRARKQIEDIVAIISRELGGSTV